MIESISPGHSCGHSYCELSAKSRILSLVNESAIELSPREISLKTGVRHSTTRKYLRNLLRDGDMIQPYPGAYCSKSIHAVRFVPLKFHNIVLSISAPWLDYGDSSVEICGSVKIRVTYGRERRRITGWISCDAGMDKDTTLFAVHRFIDIVEEKTKQKVESFIIKTFEANRDYQGIRLDGFRCVTVKGLFGALARIYQKEPDVVRHEFKISKSMSFDEFQALIHGSASSYNLEQGLFVLGQEIKRLTEASKSQNGILKAIFDRLGRGDDS